jgi:uncharacterized membrane protein YqhA
MASKFLRLLSLFPILACVAGSGLMFVQGIYKIYKGAISFLDHLEGGLDATRFVISAMDSFLIALVLLVFAGGMFELFYDEEHKSTFIPQWLKVNNISHLKHILAEVIILVLCVHFLDLVLVNGSDLAWEMMIFPLSVLCLSVSLKVLELKKD